MQPSDSVTVAGELGWRILHWHCWIASLCTALRFVCVCVWDMSMTHSVLSIDSTSLRHGLSYVNRIQSGNCLQALLPKTSTCILSIYEKIGLDKYIYNAAFWIGYQYIVNATIHWVNVFVCAEISTCAMMINESKPYTLEWNSDTKIFSPRYGRISKNNQGVYNSESYPFFVCVKR